jgi:NADH:ubiquinone oxidoreductase subunit F (NADH-binding)/(2Fe-2S) ferredoxin
MRKMTVVLVSTDSNSILNGAKQYEELLNSIISDHNMSDLIQVMETGTFGVYENGVLFQILPDDIFYLVKSPSDVKKIFEEHLLKGRRVNELKVDLEKLKVSKPSEVKETKIVLRNAGVINPNSIEEYIGRDGYQALAKAFEIGENEVINEIKESKLRGRGGAGFPTGLKWEMTKKSKSDKKYVICNADEGEPGTFKDRIILEGDPHSIIEAMIIAGFSVGANIGYIYIRGEYQESINRMQKAIKDAEKFGFLGENILNSGFSFQLAIRPGAGAYVVGDETALMESLEGKAGRPRLKPPYPTDKGLFGKPTLINNVETLANIPWILLNGAEKFRSYGTQESSGTKVFSLVGNISHRGVVELPMGTSLREIIYNFGGGAAFGKKIKAVQTGGTAGTFLKPDELDIPMAYESIKNGVSLGSGSILVIDEDNCMVDVAKGVAKFYMHESCGKCTPCREGTKMMYKMISDISRGRGNEKNIERIEEMAKEIADSAFCGLGQSIALPISSIVQKFREEFETHIKDKTCPANVCVFETKK